MTLDPHHLGRLANLIPLPMAMPLLTAAVLIGGSKWIKRRAADIVTITVTLACLALCGGLTWVSSKVPVVYWFGGWHPHRGVALGISFAIDPIGAWVSTLACFLMLASLVFSWSYFDAVETVFHGLMLVFLGAMVGFSLTGDIFNLFVFFELMGVAAYALTGYKVEEPLLEGALNFSVTNSVGGFMILIGIGLLYGRTGALNMAQIGSTLSHAPADGLVITALAFLLVGLLIKGAIFPFHFWLDDAHAVAPTPVCVLMSGVMVPLGIYGVARIYTTVFAISMHAHQQVVSNLLLGSGAITVVLGSMMCLLQRNFKRLLAFSTISHMGMVLIGLALFSVKGLAGAVLYAGSHGLVKGALFLCAGMIMHRHGSVDELSLKGKGRDQPMVFAFLGFAW